MSKIWGSTNKVWGGTSPWKWGVSDIVAIPEDAFYYHSKSKYYENPPALKRAIKKRELLNQKLEKKQDAVVAAPTPILWQGNSDVEKLQRDIADIQQSIVKNEESIRVIIMQHNERMAELEEEEFLMLTN